MTFQTFTGKEYLKIDIANNFGLEKKNWDERISWFDANEHQLDALLKTAKEPALFYAGTRAWQKTKQGKPTGYMISLDATSSGIQILACLAGDRKAAEICNVVDIGQRVDAYTLLYDDMNAKIGQSKKLDPKQTKKAIMTAFYGSTAMPKRVFGEDELLEAFFETMKEKTPGAWEINESMLMIWDSEALEHTWVLPDNFHVRIKVMGNSTERVQFLNEAFDVTYAQNQPIENGRSLGANTVHSIDGMIVREMLRRCNYDQDQREILVDLVQRGVKTRCVSRSKDDMLLVLWGRYLQSGFFSARILDYIDVENIGLIDHKVLTRLLNSLPVKPFEMISVHDCFRCHPNYGNDLRQQYNNLLAEIAESRMLENLISQIVDRQIGVTPLDPNMGSEIRVANYALS